MGVHCDVDDVVERCVFWVITLREHSDDNEKD